MEDYIILTILSDRTVSSIKKNTFKSDDEFHQKIQNLIDESKNDKTMIYIYKDIVNENIRTIGIIRSGLLFTY